MLLVTLPQVEEDILEYHRLLASSPRSDPCRSARLRRLAGLRAKLNALSRQKGNLDKSITHLAEAVLLPFQPSRDVVHMFFQLASGLLHASQYTNNLKISNPHSNTFAFFELTPTPLKLSASRMVNLRHA